jgi:hypothetical protein
MGHAAIKSLPPEILAKIDRALVGGKSAALLAKALHAEGYLKQVSEESLARELRKYRKDTIDIPAAARAVSISKSPHPATQKAILAKAHDYDVMADLFKLIQAQQKRVQKWLDMPAGAMPSTAILNDIKALTDMFVKFNTACMDRGLLPRAATNVNVRAEHVVVDASNVEVVIQALLTYMNQDDPKNAFGDSLVWQREFVEQAQVRHVAKQVARLVHMPADQFEAEYGRNAQPVLEGEVVRDATAVRVE